MFGLTPYRRNQQALAYNPFREMEELQRRFFEEPFGSFYRTGGLAEFKTDITDQGDSYLLEADLPGFEKEDIHLGIDGNLLTISAERHSEYENKDKKGNYISCERSYGTYSRSFDISNIDQEGIKAKLDKGVLKLTLPKKPEVVPTQRQLEIA
ncbi:MAG: Hsp20/alpha crystallin family protein [Clostridia bacterium]|nr:Hsp20/alpha crystallin family protein [Clostridia bacterium]